MITREFLARQTAARFPATYFSCVQYGALP
jgi:hypothetical protein